MIHEGAIDESNDNLAPEEVLSSAVPKLICCSGRTEDAVQAMFTKFEEVQNNPNAFNLMAELSSIPPVVHPYRGYAILGGTAPKKDIQV